MEVKTIKEFLRERELFRSHKNRKKKEKGVERRRKL